MAATPYPPTPHTHTSWYTGTEQVRDGGEKGETERKMSA